MRRNAKVDGNQAAITKAFRDYGCSVEPTHMIGGDFPDLICALQQRTWLVECKDGTQPPSKRKLSDGQKTFHAAWRGMIFTVLSANDVPDVIDFVLTHSEIFFTRSEQTVLTNSAAATNVRLRTKSK